MKYFQNKAALITGAAGLLGYYHSEALAENGFDLVLIDINKTKLNNTASKLIKKYPSVEIFTKVCDIRFEKNIKVLKKTLDKKNIHINCLINNADVNPSMMGNNKKSKIENYSSTRLLYEINVGVIGTFNCCKIFGSEMAKNNEGTIINISSDLGISAPDQRVYHKSENINNVKNFKPIGYTISKHAISGITKYLSTYWGHKNVRCNTLALGAVFNNQPKFLFNNVKKRIPLNRWAKKTEYKKAIQFLASEENSYMTGQTLTIDGGRTIW